MKKVVHRNTKLGAVIGVDVGTSACKAVLLDDGGRTYETAPVGYATRRSLAGEVSQASIDWLRAVATVLADCRGAAGDANVEAISITAPAHVAVLLDAEDRPLARPLLAWDRRPAGMLPDLRRELGDSFFERTFVELTTGWTMPQLAWLRRELGPATWARLRLVLTQKDYVRYALTGQAATDPTDAQGMALLDPMAGTWALDLARLAGLDESSLPPIVPSTSLGGGLSKPWARRTGLAAGTPVCVGATDTAVELVSVGALSPGSSLIKIASTGTVVTVTATPRPDRRILTYPHAIAGLWYHLGATNNAATSYIWLRETVFAADRRPPAEVYAEMDALASAVPPGSDGLLFLPFLDGERTPYWDPHLRGAFVGLTSAHQRAHLCRAVLEGVALSLRACRDVFTELRLPVTRPALGGGGSRSRLWRSILVSVLNEPARMLPRHGPAIGAAIIAAQSVGLELPAPQQRATTVAPRRGWIDIYEQVYASYRQGVELARPLMHRLSDDGARSASHPGM